MSSTAPDLVGPRNLLDQFGSDILGKLFNAREVRAFVMNSEQVVIEWGAGMEKVLGWSREQVAGAEFPGVGDESEHDWNVLFNQALKANTSETTVQLQGINNQDVLVNITLTPLEDENDDVSGVLATLKDIEGRRQVEQNLRDFVYSASHDLKEPLRKIVGFGDLLEMDIRKSMGDPPSQVLDDLEEITDATERMKGLVDSLLRLSRAGRRSLDKQTKSMDVSIDLALESLETVVNNSDANIERDEMPTVDMDSQLISQVWQNFISNGIKFVQNETPELILTHEKEDSSHVFGVKDNGIGIDQEYIDEIFEPFQRLHGRGEFEGSGIGLSICKKIVNRHGGTMMAESTEGEGSHVKFTLPEVSDE
jgi:PAS domain S-box-containing protein